MNKTTLYPSSQLMTTLLKSVSRSFYLSLRVLPKAIRSPLSLAYLLARATDTIADTNELTVTIRVEQMAALIELILQGNDVQRLKTLQQQIMPLQKNLAERNLIANLAGCLTLLEQFGAEDHHYITDVLIMIAKGQSFDLHYFEQAKENIIALQTIKQLDDYTYQVAGCVGEFWTWVCHRHLTNFATIAPNKMAELGINFGKGLQLVNVLRDLPFDLQQGRCYMPQEQLNEYGLTVATLQTDSIAAKRLIDFWCNQAASYLKSGWRYCQNLKNKRVLFACVLPLFLGLHTLSLLHKEDYLASQKRVKVARKDVYRCMLLVAYGLFNKKILQAEYKRLIKNTVDTEYW